MVAKKITSPGGLGVPQGMRHAKPRVSAHKNFCKPKAEIEALYWPLVDKRRPGECWAWLGKVSKNGLGILPVRTGTHRQTLTARQLAVLFSGQPLPDAHVFVRGQCPNRLCVNPNHLQLGNSHAVSNEPPYLALDDLRARFTEKKKSEGPKGCILWEASKNEHGYGKMICADLDGKKRVLFAHKVAIFIATEKWPRSDEAVCHDCDNPSCVNPEHMYVGDWKTNARDAALRGRHKRASTRALREAAVARGCYQTPARWAAYAEKELLTAAQKRSIRKTYAANQALWKGGKPKCGCKYTQAAIVTKLGCGENTVARAIHRSVSEAKPETRKRNELIRKLYFGPHGHARCIELGIRSNRPTLKALAEKYGVSSATIDDAIHGRRKLNRAASKAAPKRRPHPPKRS